MAVVPPLNNFMGPEGDTVTVAEQLLNTEYLRPTLLGTGLCGAGRARATAGAAACAGPGRAVAGGVRWGVRGACAGGVGARQRWGCVAGFRKGAAAAGVRGRGRRVGGRMLAGR